MTKEVGILLKVGASGLENVNALSKALQAAGVETTALDARAAELSAELQKLSSQDRLIDAFAKQKTAVGEAEQAMLTAQETAAKLGVEIGGIEAPTRKQAAAFAAARQAAKEASEDYQAQRLTLQGLREQLTSTGISTDELAAAQVKARTGAAAAREQLTALEGSYRALGASATAEAQAMTAATRASEESRAATAKLVTEAKSAGNVLQQAFQQTGVKSLEALEAEIISTEAAVSTLQRRFEAGSISAADLARAVGSAEVKINALKTEMATIPAGPGKFQQLSDQVTQVAGKFGALTASIAAVGFAVKPVIDATIALDQLRRVLITVTGSATSADQQIEFLRGTAQRSGLAFSEIADAYAKFAASALQSGLSVKQIESVFGSVTLAAGNLGLSSQQAGDALNALGQIASKGTVAMEELRQQLGDALPGVMPLLAKELGLTQAELIKVVEAGNLLANEAIPAIGRALQKLGPEQGAQVEGLSAIWSRFKNAVEAAGVAIADGPLGKGSGVILGGLTYALERILFVAVAASEGLKLVGNAIGLFAGAAVQGKAGSEQLSQSLYGAAQRANDNIVSFGKMIGVIDRATERQIAAVVANNAAAKSLADGSTAGDAAARSFAAVALRTQEANDAAERSATFLGNVSSARRAELEQMLKFGSIAGDEVTTRTKVAALSATFAQAKQAEIQAEEKLLDTLRASRDRELAKLTADHQVRMAQLVQEGASQKDLTAAEDAVGAAVARLREEYSKKILTQRGVVEQTEVAAKAAADEALQYSLAAKAIKDTSGQYAALAEAVQVARRNYDAVERSFAKGKATTDDLAKADRELQKAKAELNLAIDAQAKNSASLVEGLQLEAEYTTALLKLDIEKLKNRQAEALSLGNELEARQLGIRIAEAELAIKKTSTQATIAEANETIRAAAIRKNQIEQTRELTQEEQVAYTQLVRKQQIRIVEAQAQDESTKQTEKNIEAVKQGREAVTLQTGSILDNSAATKVNTGVTGDNTTARAANASAATKQASGIDAVAAAEQRFQNQRKAAQFNLPGLVAGSGGLGNGQVGGGSSGGASGEWTILPDGTWVPPSSGTAQFYGSDGRPFSGDFLDPRTGEVVHGTDGLLPNGGPGSPVDPSSFIAPATLGPKDLIYNETPEQQYARVHKDLPKIDSYGDLIRNAKSGEITRTGSAQGRPPDNSGDWEFDAALFNSDSAHSTSLDGGSTGRLPDPSNTRYWRYSAAAIARKTAENAATLAEARQNDPYGFRGGAGYSPLGRAAREASGLARPKGTAGGDIAGVDASGNVIGSRGLASESVVAGRYEIVFKMGATTSTVSTYSKDEAENLVRLLQEQFKQTGG